MKRLWRPILVGALAGLLLFAFALLFSAGGHNLVLLMIFFPWAMLLTTLLPQLPWWPVVFALFAIEGPVYGLVYGLIVGKLQQRKIAFWSLLFMVHILGVVWCFVFDAKESWRVLFR